MNNIKRMSINSLLFPNQFNLNAQTINVSGIASNLTKIAPIITSSNVLCSNLYVQRAVTCDTPGNIATTPFTITNSPIPTYVLTGVDATHVSWQEIPEAEPAKYLMTDTGSVKIYNSDAPAVGDVLIALSATEAAWGPQSGSGSNIAAFLETTGAPVNVKSSVPPLVNQYLKSTSATTAIWANVTSTNALYANVSGYSINSLHSQWADFANAIPATTVTPGIYGDATHVGKFTVNATGQLTQAANVAISFPPAGNLTGPVTSVGLATTITATGVTSQKYGNATSVPSFTVNTAGQLTQAANIAITFPPAGNLTGPVTSIGLATTIAATGVTAQKYGNATSVPSFTVNTAGQLTQAGNVAISFPAAGNLTGPISSVGLTTSITSQTGTGTTFVVQTDPIITNPSFTQITNTGVLTLPTTTDTLTGRSTTDTLINKTLTDNSNNVIARGLWQGSGASSVSTYAAIPGTTGQVLTMNSLTTAAWSTPASGGQLTFSDSTFAIYDVTDNTKQIQFDAVGTTSTKTTITSSQTVNRVLTLPDLTDMLVGRNTTDTLTNKTLTTPIISSIVNTGTLTLPTTSDTLIGTSTTDTLINKTITNNSNNVISRSLWAGSGASSVSTYAATAPTTGQILTATNSSTATWQAPAAATNVTTTLNASDIIYHVGTIGAGTGSYALQQSSATYVNASNGNFSIASPGSLFVAGASSSINVYATTNQLNLGAAAGPKTTITAPAAPSSITLTLPNALSDTLVARNTTDTLTNKTMTASSNNIISRSLWNGSGAASVSTYASTAPTSGQLLVASAATTAVWQGFGAGTNPRFGYTTTVSSASVVTMTASSNYIQVCTGTVAQTYNLPPSAFQGQSYIFLNTTNKTMSIAGSGGGAAWNFALGTSAMIICKNANGTAATDWNFITFGATG